MPFAYSVTIVDPNHVLDDTLLADTVNLALSQWSQVLAGRGSMDVEVDIGATGHVLGRAGGTSAVAVTIGMDGARTISEGGATAELLTGVDPNGSASDIIIGLDPAYGQTLFLTNSLAAQSPANLVDGVFVFEHELGHALGITGYYDANTGVLSPVAESPFDRLLNVAASKISFMGPLTDDLYGGPVPITADNTHAAPFYHVGVSDTDPIIGRDLMNGIFSVNGVRIDLLDIAMEADVGNPLSPLGQLELAYGILERRPQLADITAADLSAIATSATAVQAGSQTLASALATLVMAAGATTSVATLAYEFFTGSAPSAAGMDYLVSPTGPNPNNLNSAYYQSFSLENRYINFAVNLGKVGAGEAAFSASYGALDLFDATRKAYTTIFGGTPSDAKLHALLDPTFQLNGVTLTRADYFALYGGDGPGGLGTKAAMVGWLLSEAVKADLGAYAQSNDAFLSDVALHGAPFGVDIIGHYNQASFAYLPG